MDNMDIRHKLPLPGNFDIQELVCDYILSALPALSLCAAI